MLNVDQDHLDGYRSIDRAIVNNYTSGVNASASYDYATRFKFVSTIGTQFTDVGFTRTDAFGAKLLAGTNSLAGTTARFAVSESNSDVKTLGFLARQQVAFADRLFLTAAVRTDRNSAFGSQFNRVYYPSLSASWVVSDESYFPKINSISSFRLRAARGSSGQNPGYLAAEQFYNPVAVAVHGTDVPAFTVGGVGNAGLQPEKSTETEGGFDLGMFSDRVNVEYTYYNKLTKDALVNVNLAPSLGSATNQFKNLGSVRNSGNELVVRADVLNRDMFKADITVNGSWTKNNLETLGKDANNVPIPQFTGGFDDTQIFKPGLPLGAYYIRAVHYNDANKDGLIGCPSGVGTASCEFTIDSLASFQGTPFPDGRAQHHAVDLARQVRARDRDVRPPRRAEDLQSHRRLSQRDLPERLGRPGAERRQPRGAGGGAGSGGDEWIEWRLHRGCVVHQASRSDADAHAATALCGTGTRELGDADLRGTQPENVDELQRLGSGAQRRRAGELHDD